MKREYIVHPIPPTSDKNSEILILGSFPSQKSREAGYFYGNPNNRFWRIMAALYGEETPATVEERRAFLLRNRVAVWDVIASCAISGAADSSIRDVVPNDITPILTGSKIKAIFCNGRLAYDLYRRHIEQQAGFPAVCLPSTSPANAAWTLPRLMEAWRAAGVGKARYDKGVSGMIIETERLILRPWKESDAESLYEYAKDPRVGPAAGWSVHTSVENSRQIIADVLSDPETYAVCLKTDNRAIGSVGLFPPKQAHVEMGENELEIGFWIAVPFWGNGYIPEAVRALQKHAFEELGCTAIWCGYYEGNEKSKRAQEKCGFIYDHTEENKPCSQLDELRTEHFNRLTKERWLELTR